MSQGAGRKAPNVIKVKKTEDMARASNGFNTVPPSGVDMANRFVRSIDANGKPVPGTQRGGYTAEVYVGGTYGARPKMPKGWIEGK